MQITRMSIRAGGPNVAPLRTARGAFEGSPETAGEGGLTVGVLALQGDVPEHLRMLRGLGVDAREVKRPQDLDGLDGIVLPGGESTTIGKLATLYGLLEPLRERIAAGLPAFGTCAGAILLGHTTLGDDGRPFDQPLLGVMDVTTRRNAFGRQVASFEADLDVNGITGGAVHAVFIRAPWIESVGPQARPLATVPLARGDTVVVARQGHMLASAFHPELTDDGRMHALFVRIVREHHVAATG